MLVALVSVDARTPQADVFPDTSGRVQRRDGRSYASVKNVIRGFGRSGQAHGPTRTNQHRLQCHQGGCLAAKRIAPDPAEDGRFTP